METILEVLTVEHLNQFLHEVKTELKKVQYSTKEVLTLNEAAEFLTLSKSALYKLTSKKEIPCYSPGGKMIYFKRSELETWIFNFRATSVNDVSVQIDNYLAKTSKSLLS